MTDIMANKATSASDALQPVRDNLSATEVMVGHELSLIGNRMTWFAISQSFLFGAYATIATDPARLRLLDPKRSEQLPGEFTTFLILVSIPLVGLLFAFAAFKSVGAAGRVLDELMTQRGKYLKLINESARSANTPSIPVIGTSQDRLEYSKALLNTIRDGELPLWLLPFGMGLIWVAVLGIRIPWQSIGNWIKTLGPT